MDKHRLFLGIPLDENYSSQIENKNSLLNLNIWRKIQKDNLHLTVLFIGDVDSEIIPYIEEISENIANRSRPFSFNGGRTKIMQPDKPTMLWIKFERNRWFELLVKDIEGCFKKIGTWEKVLARRQYGDSNPIAHITLAKIKGGGMLDSLLPPFDTDAKTDSFTARKLALYESIRNNNNETEYKILKEWDLIEK